MWLPSESYLWHPRVPVAVRDEYISRLWVHQDICRSIERITLLPSRRFPTLAKSEDYLPRRSPLLDDMVIIIGEVQIVVAVDEDAVRTVELARSPRLEEVAFGIEDHHRPVAAVEDVDTVLRIDRHRRRLFKRHRMRQLRPVRYRLVWHGC